MAKAAKSHPLAVSQEFEYIEHGLMSASEKAGSQRPGGGNSHLIREAREMMESVGEAIRKACDANKLVSDVSQDLPTHFFFEAPY